MANVGNLNDLYEACSDLFSFLLLSMGRLPMVFTWLIEEFILWTGGCLFHEGKSSFR
jgi:hypothetical protein